MTAARTKKQIVAMGGGSFSAEPEGSALDAYVLSLTGKPRPKICFVPTASGDAPEYTANMAWGDADFRSLFITASTSVYRIRVQVPGLPAL